MVMPKRGNNQGAASCPSESNHAVEQAFLRLGDVLAEIASASEQAKAKITEDTSANKSNIAQSPQSLDDAECKNGNERKVRN